MPLVAVVADMSAAAVVAVPLVAVVGMLAAVAIPVKVVLCMAVVVGCAGVAAPRPFAFGATGEPATYPCGRFCRRRR